MLGAACGLASAVLGSVSQLTIRKLGNAERAPVIAMVTRCRRMGVQEPPAAQPRAAARMHMRCAGQHVMHAHPPLP